jgi:transcriptional regulator with XRE-family HTH domain
MHPESLGNRLRMERYKRNMTQTQVCIELGMKVTTLSLIENDKGNPRKSTIKRICDFFGMKAPLNE